MAAEVATEAANARAAHEAEEEAQRSADYRVAILDVVTASPSQTKTQIVDAIRARFGNTFDVFKLSAALWRLLDDKNLCVEVKDDGSHRFDIDIQF